jgi:hypothetical protein
MLVGRGLLVPGLAWGETPSSLSPVGPEYLAAGADGLRTYDYRVAKLMLGRHFANFANQRARGLHIRLITAACMIP